MTEVARIGVVGAGLVGLAIARQLAQRGCDVTVFEKEDRPAVHQSGHNSGVVHAGIYYAPGTLKAQLCRRGIGLLKEFCEDHAIAYREIGKLVVARDVVEADRLGDLETRARANNVPGLRRLRGKEICEIEPAVEGIAALHSPSTAITDYPAIAAALVGDLEQAGGRVEFGAAVEGLAPTGNGVEVRTRTTTRSVGELVICAGLQSDRVARLAGDDPAPAIVPFRGEYFRLTPARQNLVRGLVYPVPDPDYPFLGVHFTPRVSGVVDIGPNAVPAAAREGYRWRDVNPRDVAELIRSPGSRALARRHWRVGLHEFRGSLSRHRFLDAAREYVPTLQDFDVVRAPAGVRAQAVDRDGTLVDDFRIHSVGRVTAIRNAPSPAATSCLAIAEHVVSGLLGH